MKLQGNWPASRAWSRFELAVVVAMLSFSCVLLLVFLTKSRRGFNKLTCANKLDRIGLAFHEFGNSHSWHSPMAVSSAEGGTREFTQSGLYSFKHLQILSNSLVFSDWLVCPDDNRRAAGKTGNAGPERRPSGWSAMANSNVSYFVGLDAEFMKPASVLAGDRNVMNNSDTVVPLRSASNWVKIVGLHGDLGHVLFADGHVEELNTISLSRLAERSGSLTNRLSVP